jgi:adenylate kinase
MMHKQREFTKVECLLIIFLIAGCIGTIAVYCFVFHSMTFGDAPSDFALFGDYIGGVTGTIIGLIGIVFLYRTYRIQLDISSTQEEIQQKQQFEETFFSLLGQQRSIVLNLKGKFPIGDGQVFEEKSNYEYIAQLRDDLSEQLRVLNFESNALREGKTNLLKIQVNEIYQNLFLSHAPQLGHYFRHLYHLLKFIHDSKGIDKKKYFDLVQAQMGFDELYLVAINGISNYGRRRMLPLLNESSFLENLVIDDDEIVRRLIQLFYPKTKRKDIDTMRRNIIFVGGIHGVGKSTFTSNVKKQLPSIELLSCSKVLKWENPSEKRVDNVRANQNRLIENLRELVDIDKPYLLDGHFCLVNKEGRVERIGIDTFRDINPEAIILLTGDIDKIINRLANRDGKQYDKGLVEQLYSEEQNWAKEIADKLGIHIYELESSQYGDIQKEMKEFVDSFK